MAGSYPIDGQYNFYKKELTNHKGYILLKKGQPDLFFENEGHDLAVRFRRADGACQAVPVSYDAFSFKVVFDIPADFLDNGAVYRMELVKVPTASNGYSPGPCDALPPSQPGSNAASSASFVSDDGKPQNTPPTIMTLHSMTFRVSEYDKFFNKIAAWDSTRTALNTWGYKNNIEPFDKFELGQVAGRPALMDMRAVLTPSATPWYANGAIQAMFNTLQPCAEGICLSDAGQFGYPPEKAAHWLHTPGNVLVGVNGSHFSSPLPEYAGVTQGLRYFVPGVTEGYYNQFRNAIYGTLTIDLIGIANAILDATGQNVTGMTLAELWGLYPAGFGSYAPIEYFNFYFGYPDFPQPSSGPYKVVFRYRPPGMSFDTSMREVSLYKN